MHPCYAESLSEFGTPRELLRCKGWVLERPIPGLTDRDAMCCYPLFVCQDWYQLHSDLETLEIELVSLALVTDPFGEYDRDYLNRCFEHVVPFKEHFVVDLNQQTDNHVSEHHRRYIRKSLQHVTVELCEEPIDFIDEWAALYQELILRHGIKGITAFSKESFAKQLSVPGLVMFRAVSDDKTLGMLLWYVHGDVAYYHLGSTSPRGLELHASFALFSFALKYFADNGLRWLELGAGAGIGGDGTDGLTRFKRGWSTGTRTAYFCGRIFDPERYAQIVKAKGMTTTDYFPAYRKGEFA
ncbi:hypothetical protein Gura_2357 [Geotalea uraniireducens Rf4]|uniref:BioF2-like acetyltransferase domain-containing protein n=1 Tax=Geotalea uraniireducens (strain Rf4) TaxID=351605 RepID=A5G418_GEOUR|nr:hypothetical protein Gura_2357 [Geotalea uraniireducens Rf4]